VAHEGEPTRLDYRPSDPTDSTWKWIAAIAVCLLISAAAIVLVGGFIWAHFFTPPSF
jgi:hypothetical protein